MIFSGHVTSYRCDGCAAEYAHVAPTSLLPIGAVVALASVPWGHTLARVIPYRGLSIAAGVVAAIASLGLTYKLVEALTTRALRRARCPKCGARITQTGGGFYDGLVPNRWEVVIYLVVLALAFGVAAALNGARTDETRDDPRGRGFAVRSLRQLDANEPPSASGVPAHTAHAGVEHAEDTVDP